MLKFLLNFALYLALVSNKLLINSSQIKTLTIKNGEKYASVAVKVGDVVSIILSGNPTTGFNWFLTNTEEAQEEGVVPLNLNEFNSGEYIPDHNEPGVAGSGGKFVFKFRTENKVKGSFDLDFIYKRMWEKESNFNESLTKKIYPNSRI